MLTVLSSLLSLVFPLVASVPSEPTAVQFTSVTPNLVVDDVQRSVAFYRDVLGFTVKQTVPAEQPFVFVWLERGAVPVFLNDRRTVEADIPAARAIRGGSGLFFVVTGVDALYEQVRERATVLMTIRNQPYGMREFTVADPDGFVLTFAERQ